MKRHAHKSADCVTPLMPRSLLPTAAVMPATWVPCPFSSDAPLRCWPLKKVAVDPV